MQIKRNFKILAVLPSSPGLRDVCSVTDAFFQGCKVRKGWHTMFTALEDTFMLNSFGWNNSFLIFKLLLPYSQTFLFTREAIWTSDPWYKASSCARSMREGTDLPFQKEDQTQVVCRWSFGYQWHRGRNNVTFSFSYNLWESFNLNVQSLCSAVTIPTYVLLNVFLNNLITSCVSTVSVLARGSQFLEIWWAEH